MLRLEKFITVVPVSIVFWGGFFPLLYLGSMYVCNIRFIVRALTFVTEISSDLMIPQGLNRLQQD